MTLQDLQELERVQLEWYAARDAFEKAVQDSESLAEIDEALNTLQQKGRPTMRSARNISARRRFSLASGNMSKVTQHLVHDRKLGERRGFKRRDRGNQRC
jgi:hypothetical protein